VNLYGLLEVPATIRFAVAWIEGRLINILISSPTEWHTGQWATLGAVSLIVFSFLFRLGYTFSSNKLRREFHGETFKALSENWGHWTPEQVKGKKSIRLEIGMWVTNIYPDPLSIVKCRLAKFGEWGFVSIVVPLARTHEFRFPPKQPVFIATRFSVRGIRPTNGQTIVSDVSMIDNLESEKIIKDCVFHFQPPEKKSKRSVKENAPPSAATSQAPMQNPKDLATSIQKILPKSLAADLSIATRLSEEVGKVLSKQPGIDIAWLLRARSSELQNALSKMDLTKGIDINSKGWAELMRKLLDPSKEQGEK